jgi:hypothetical protein
VDGKGVAMRPEARRRYYGKKALRARTFGKRLGTGEKAAHKRMAETGVVFDVLPLPGAGADPGAGHDPRPREPARGPEAVNRWYQRHTHVALVRLLRTNATSGRLAERHAGPIDRAGPCRPLVSLPETEAA